MDQIYKMVQELERRVKQYAENPNDGTVQQLWNEAHQLGEEIQMKKGYQNLESRIKSVQARLEAIKSQGLFSPGDVDDLYDRSQDIRESLRDFA
jgi:biotin-(acetyl-CoA carboxylase) ligase